MRPVRFLALASAILAMPTWSQPTTPPSSEHFQAATRPIGAPAVRALSAGAQSGGAESSVQLAASAASAAHPTTGQPKAQVGDFCSDLQLHSNPPDRQNGSFAESTCAQCATPAFVPADAFFVSGPSYLTEIILWGNYLLDDRPPPVETWTVTIHAQDEFFPATQPSSAISRQVITELSRMATGEVSFGNDEYRWALRLKEPVYLPAAGYYWMEAFHDSPDAGVDAVLGSAPLQFGAGADGFVSSTTAPGEAWELIPGFDIAFKACGFDADWAGLIVPGFQLDLANPADTTLFAVRNTNVSGRTIRVSYFGDRFFEGPLRVDTFSLNPEQTQTVNVGLNTTGLDPDGDGKINGFIIISEADGTWDDLEGDFSRVDFANDFAAGSRMIEADDFCQRQEIRVVDFGSGSDYNVLLREALASNNTAMRVTILDEAGGSMLTQNVPGNGSNMYSIAIEELSDSLAFGTLIFDFEPSGGGVVTGRYSAFGRFSTEVNGVCRD